MNDQTTGFILNRFDFQEYDEIIQVFTKEYGLLSFISKSSKKPNSKNRYALNYFMEVNLQFDYFKHKDLQRLKKAEIIKNYQNLDHLIQIIGLQVINEITLNILKNTDNYLKYYDFLLQAYQAPTKDIYLWLCFMMVQLLKEEGVAPKVDSCVYCDNKEIHSLSYQAGGFICRHHLKIDNLVLKPLQLRKFLWINKVAINQLYKLENYDYNYDDFKILYDFYKMQYESEFKSYKILQKCIDTE